MVHNDTGTAIGSVIDYLVTSLPAPAVAAVPDALVVDAYTSDNLSPNMIYVGRTNPDLQVGIPLGGRVFPNFGSRNVQEKVEITGFIDCYAPGTVMKPARDNAVALYNVICHLLASDPWFGGILNVQGELSEILLIQMDDPNNATRRATIPWKLTFTNRYHP